MADVLQDSTLGLYNGMFCGEYSIWVGRLIDLVSLTGFRLATMDGRLRKQSGSARSISGSPITKSWRWWQITFSITRNFKGSAPTRVMRAPGRISSEILIPPAHYVRHPVARRGMGILPHGGGHLNTTNGALLR